MVCAWRAASVFYWSVDLKDEILFENLIIGGVILIENYSKDV